ncbi:sensor histidine kinase [Ruicaihuangia caeni]|uniref:sensor histidine kinase n=1 Tax=Ruicaihuangia caeni TaxID=3042517 RepID=UPI00338EAABF
MGIRVLPGAAVAAVNSGSISRVTLVVGAVTLISTVPVLLETLLVRGRAHELPLPLLMLAVMFLGVLAAILRPRVSVVLAYLVVGGAAGAAYQVALLHAQPALLDEALFLLNRPMLALTAVGAAVTTARVGIGWLALGFAVATASGFSASAIAEVPYRPGFGPAMVLVVGSVAYLTLAAVQRRARERMPNFDELEREMLQIAHGQRLAKRTTAVVHDTLLGDLAVIMNLRGAIDHRTSQWLRTDLDTVKRAEWLSANPAAGDRAGDPDSAGDPTSDRAGGDAGTDAAKRRSGGNDPATASHERSLRQALAELVPEYQWRGLSVQLTIADSADERLGAEASAALVAAVRASLENVLRHSGASSAELDVMADDQELAALIVDQGVGFDPDEVRDDRLGLRVSVRERMEGVGGRARIWSSPGVGTSVMLTVPAPLEGAS